MRYAGLVIIKQYENEEPKFLTLYHCKKKEHPWRFAGGKLEPGETPLEAACREAVEELGIELLSVEYVGKYSSQIDGDTWTGFFFLCEHYSGQIKNMEPEKVSEMKWMTLEELLSVDSYPESRVVAEMLSEQNKSLATEQKKSETVYGVLESWER